MQIRPEKITISFEVHNILLALALQQQGLLRISDSILLGSVRAFCYIYENNIYQRQRNERAPEMFAPSRHHLLYSSYPHVVPIATTQQKTVEAGKAGQIPRGRRPTLQTVLTSEIRDGTYEIGSQEIQKARYFSDFKKSQRRICVQVQLIR